MLLKQPRRADAAGLAAESKPGIQHREPSVALWLAKRRAGNSGTRLRLGALSPQLLPRPCG